MKKYIPIFILSAIFFSCKTNETSLYVGTYTNETSEGIYKLTFNQETGELTNATLVAKTSNPSFLTFDSEKKYVYEIVSNDLLLLN